MTTPAYRLSRRTALGLFGAVLAFPRAGLAGSIEAVSGAAFGTHWHIAAPAGSAIARLVPAIEALFSRIDGQLSPWRADSAISRFNMDPALQQVADPALTEVTAAALRIAGQSDGAFDPTVGPLVAQWGFGPIHRGGAPDWRGISAGPGGLAKARGDLTLDLCGIAKGWALDRAAALLRDAGFRNLLFDLGGELLARGQHPDGRDWRVAVEAPQGPAAAALRLPDRAAVATSGTQVQDYRLNGRHYSHIIDPGKRVPAESRLRSVTVVAEDSMTADGWATALCAAGETAGPDLAATQDIAALFLIETDAGLRQVRTGRIVDFIL